MNILLDKLDTVVIDGQVIKIINTDYRVCLKYFKLIRDNRFSNDKKYKKLIEMFFGKEFGGDHELGLRSIIKYVTGSDIHSDDEYNNETPEITFDFDIDANLIFASFYQQYNIDLLETSMNWNKFLVLLTNLSEETPFKQMIKLRTMDIPHATKDNIAFVSKLIRLKKEVAIEYEQEDDYG